MLNQTNNFPDEERDEAYVLGLMTSGLWLEWAQFCQTEEGAKVRRSLRKRFRDWSQECQVLGEDVECGIGEVRKFLTLVLEEEGKKSGKNRETGHKTSHQGKKVRKTTKKESSKEKSNKKAKSVKKSTTQPVKFKNISKK